jgi:hypothetical protein
MYFIKIKQWIETRIEKEKYSTKKQLNNVRFTNLLERRDIFSEMRAIIQKVH